MIGVTALLALAMLPNQANFAKLDPVPFTQVAIRDRFWSPRQETNRKATVEHTLRMLEKAGNFLVMRLAAEGKREGYQGLLFTDSDLYKSLEGISYTLATHPNPALAKRVDEIIAMIAAAQQPDGYLDTWYQVTRPDQKWTNLRDNHELYCAGHLFEAAVAHYRATGKRNLLEIALKLATLIDKRYGPSGSVAYCGHPEIELALVKLWKATGDDRWFALSRRMVENRGSGFFAEEHRTPREAYDGTYWLDDVPIRDHRDIKGHAVRAAYLLAGTADIARETEDSGLIRMLDRVWRSATERRIFVTGGIGPSGSNEGFTVDYDLPNLSAYQETCASIAMALWGHRMALLHGDARYMDAVEKALYNGVLSGVALDGKSFFYVNPLASQGNHHRQEWFGCACCPPNVLRTIASIGGYAYATSRGSLYVNLYVGGSVKASLGGRPVRMDVATNYPWDGKVALTLRDAGRFALRLRVPGWCAGPTLRLNGKTIANPRRERGYLVLERGWSAGDVVVLDLPMPIVQTQAHPFVKENLGRTAIERGPLVYCAEQTDNSVPVEEIVVPRGASMKAAFRKDVLGGVVVIEADATKVAAPDWARTLYQPIPMAEKVTAKLVPYGFWDNRKPGPMAVWLPDSPPPARVLGPEGSASVSLSFRSGNANPRGVNDGIEPGSSGDQPAALCHFWPHKGGEEWIAYQWPTSKPVRGVRVYWFDDTGRGECRLPATWKLQTKQGDEWSDLPISVYPIELNKWCEVTFPTVSTTGLRLVIRQREGWATGVHEWKVLLDDD
ncbi:MAG: glycoside hydrolase family 127 protein [Fimbriimonadaceae bacterium]|nr:glycoside hydrolase family 127 protein [Fimbriimonadaceae bacterium]